MEKEVDTIQQGWKRSWILLSKDGWGGGLYKVRMEMEEDFIK